MDHRRFFAANRESVCVRLPRHRGSKKSDILLSDLSDVPENLPLPAPGSESPQALNYSQIASAAVAVSQGAQDPSVSSTETLLRNIQGLLKVAADNARQQERQINYEKGQWRGFLKTLEAALHNFIIFQLSQNRIKRH